MKTAFFLIGLLLLTTLVIAHPIVGAASLAETNQPAIAAALAAQSEIDALKVQLDAIKRSNSDATQKWENLAQENTALSNRVADLHQTLLAQKDRELELVKQSHAFNMWLLGAAAIGLGLLVLLSYWFQIRCFNRVVEITRALPQYHSPALLEEENSANSKLLGAIRLLESRIQQLEPGHAPNPAHGHSPAIEPAPARTETASANVVKEELLPMAPAKRENGAGDEGVANQPSGASLLLAKGQILLDMDRLQEAVACFQEALAIDPKNAEAHFKKGIAWERMNRLELALGAYEEALRLNPKRAAAQVYKARVLQGLHRYDEALSVYDSALGKGAPKAGSTTLAT